MEAAFSARSGSSTGKRGIENVGEVGLSGLVNDKSRWARYVTFAVGTRQANDYKCILPNC